MSDIYRGQTTGGSARYQTHDCATLEEAETRARELWGTAYEIVHTSDVGHNWEVVKRGS
jgi:hypothetical protein